MTAQTLYIKKILFEGTPAESYLNNIHAVRAIEQRGFFELCKNVTFFIGENGSGKSTLLEAIAVAYGFNAEGGTRNFHFSSAATHSPLYKHITLVKGATAAKDGFFLRAESFYNVASEIDRLGDGLGASYGGRSLHACSHGESFIALVENRFGGNGLYVLDEPEAALSLSGQFILLSLMHRLVGKKSQFIIATHSPILLAYPDADICEFSESGISRTAYKETDIYAVTKRFLDDPESMIEYLLEK